MTIKPRTQGKINADFGMAQYYKYYKSNSKNPVDKQKFIKVVEEFNKQIVDLIINENLEYKPVKLQLTFCVRKVVKQPRIKDGKLVSYSPIDWKTTKNIWANNPEAAERKLIIRFQNNHSSKKVFNIKAMKYGNTYLNKKYYRFKACRSFQRLLAKRIFNENLDPFDTYSLY